MIATVNLNNFKFNYKFIINLKSIDHIHGRTARPISCHVSLQLCHLQLIAFEQSTNRFYIGRETNYERGMHDVIEILDHVEHGLERLFHQWFLLGRARFVQLFE